MNRRLAIAVGVMVGIIAIAVPIALSIYLASHQSLNNQFGLAASIADDILRRSDESTDQTLAIVRALKTLVPTTTTG